MSRVSLLQSGEQCYIKVINNNFLHFQDSLPLCLGSPSSFPALYSLRHNKPHHWNPLSRSPAVRMAGNTALVYIIIIISKTQIVKKPSVLYKEHDGRWGNWLMDMYKNQTNIQYIFYVIIMYAACTMCGENTCTQVSYPTHGFSWRIIYKQ